MQRLEVSRAVRPIYESLGVKQLTIVFWKRQCIRKWWQWRWRQ